MGPACAVGNTQRNTDISLLGREGGSNSTPFSDLNSSLTPPETHPQCKVTGGAKGDELPHRPHHPRAGSPRPAVRLSDSAGSAQLPSRHRPTTRQQPRSQPGFGAGPGPPRGGHRRPRRPAGAGSAGRAAAAPGGCGGARLAGGSASPSRSASHLPSLTLQSLSGTIIPSHRVRCHQPTASRLPSPQEEEPGRGQQGAGAAGGGGGWARWQRFVPNGSLPCRRRRFA